MVQRHPNDTVERLWPGATDRNDPKFVPLELHDAVADIPADIENRLRQELYTTGEMILTDGRKATHTLNPAADLDDLEMALVWRKKEWARRQLDSQRQDVERVARDAILYTCQRLRQGPPARPARAATRRAATSPTAASSPSARRVSPSANSSLSPP